MQIRQRETLNQQGAITHEVCCLAAQLPGRPSSQILLKSKTIRNASKFIKNMAKKFNFQIKKYFLAVKNLLIID
jgi:hypothetical protein